MTSTGPPSSTATGRAEPSSTTMTRAGGSSCAATLASASASSAGRSRVGMTTVTSPLTCGRPSAAAAGPRPASPAARDAERIRLPVVVERVGPVAAIDAGVERVLAGHQIDAGNLDLDRHAIDAPEADALGLCVEVPADHAVVDAVQRDADDRIVHRRLAAQLEHDPQRVAGRHLAGRRARSVEDVHAGDLELLAAEAVATQLQTSPPAPAAAGCARRCRSASPRGTRRPRSRRRWPRTPPAWSQTARLHSSATLSRSCEANSTEVPRSRRSRMWSMHLAWKRRSPTAITSSSSSASGSSCATTPNARRSRMPSL